MKKIITSEMHDFYSTQSSITDPGKYSALFDYLPTDVSEIVLIIQGLFLHIHWAEKYGVFPSNVRKQEANLRFVSKQLEQIQNMDMGALDISRPLEMRLLGTCRDFSVFLCALLRHQGIPARSRCGFGTYFTAGQYEDHWISEYWEADEQRWVTVDAQLDDFQCQALEIDFDPLDIPPSLFLTGGKAWQMCRKENADPNKFGIFNMHGLWFVRGNLVRDVASLNKMELLPWDCWALSTGEDEELSEEDFALLDQVAFLSHSDSFSFSDLRSLYQTNKGLYVPAVISSFIGGRFVEVDLTEK